MGRRRCTADHARPRASPWSPQCRRHRRKRMTTAQREPVTRVAVLIPTYNERDNLPGIVARVRASVPAADIFVLDDASPDGTGQIADELAASDPQVHVVHRAGKEGLGKAYLAGFAIVLGRGYDAAVEMDA